MGHQRIVQKTIQRAKSLGVPSVAVTMDPHPSEVLTPRHTRPLLYTLEQRFRYLADCGLDYVLVIHFTQGFSRLTADQFVRRILLRGLKAKVVCIGENFRFGHRALGTAKFLKTFGKDQGFEVYTVRPVRYQNNIISSTRIRSLIHKGDLKTAERLLGRPMSFVGKVTRGMGRGRHLGYPTVNLRLKQKVMPPSGVYAVRVRENKHFYQGALHLGPRPTFHEKEHQAEVHLLSVKKSFYGKELEFYIAQWIRSVVRFRSGDALKLQIARDVIRVKRILKRL